MSSNWIVIHTLQGNSSRLVKEQIILSAAEVGNDEFFMGCRYAMDSLITFGVKKIPISNALVAGDGLTWEVFDAIAQALIKRDLTGNAARNAIDTLMGLATENEWNYWYRRILLKDLGCGVSDKTINKLPKQFKKYHVPVFSCQLAEDAANHEKKVKGKKIIQVKLDGVRILAVVRSETEVEIFSRNGKQLFNFPDIEQTLMKYWAPLFKSRPMVLDGEVMSKTFQDLMKQVFRKTNVETHDSTLYLFDYIPLDEFDKGVWKHKQFDRTKDLEDLEAQVYELGAPSNVQVLDSSIVDLDTEHGKNKFAEINREALANNYEGIMLKDMDAPYECKRTRSWLKIKPFIEVSLSIVDFEEGTGKNEGRLGAFVCKGIDDGKEIEVKVGTGFSDEDRDSYWVNKDKLLNTIVEIKADGITQNQNGTYSLRFPRFKTFRGFDANEKI